MKSEPRNVTYRSSSSDSIARSVRTTGIPASRASTSTASQPVSTIGEKAMMSTPCSMNWRIDSTWFSCSPWASVKISSTPAASAALLDRLRVGRAPAALGADLGEAHRVPAEVGDLDRRLRGRRSRLARCRRRVWCSTTPTWRRQPPRVPSVNAIANAVTFFFNTAWFSIRRSMFVIVPACRCSLVAAPCPVPFPHVDHGPSDPWDSLLTLTSRQSQALDKPAVNVHSRCSMSAPSSDRYVVGVDFGTLTARAVVVRVADGAEVGTAVHAYRHGVIDRQLADVRRGAASGLGAAGSRGLPGVDGRRGPRRGRRRGRRRRPT